MDGPGGFHLYNLGQPGAITGKRGWLTGSLISPASGLTDHRRVQLLSHRIPADAVLPDSHQPVVEKMPVQMIGKKQLKVRIRAQRAIELHGRATIVHATQVKVGDPLVARLTEVKPPGKKLMPAADWARGARVAEQPGARLEHA